MPLYQFEPLKIRPK